MKTIRLTGGYLQRFKKEGSITGYQKLVTGVSPVIDTGEIPFLCGYLKMAKKLSALAQLQNFKNYPIAGICPTSIVSPSITSLLHQKRLAKSFTAFLKYLIAGLNLAPCHLLKATTPSPPPKKNLKPSSLPTSSLKASTKPEAGFTR